MSDLAIITECYVDTNLVETLIPPVRGYNHQMNCVKVTKVMQAKFAVGIIDKDKKAVAYISEFSLIIDTGSLCLYKHKTRHHYIIQLAPAAEQFILDSANSVNISLVDYGLSDTLDELKTFTKHRYSQKDNNLKSAFKDLKHSKNFTILSGWISYMKNKQYQIDIEKLKKIAQLDL